MDPSRRRFLVHSSTAAAAATVGALFATSGPAGAFPLGGYGPLITDPNGVVDLPAGFTYKVLATRTAVGPYPATQLGLRSAAEAGGLTPGSADGMASFYDAALDRHYIVCNHEVTSGSSGVPKTFRGNPVPTWDAGTGATGGCTTIICDGNMDVIEHLPALSGNIRNCAGGPTPWGTWLTCEENTSGISAGSGRDKNHGYLFEVDPKGIQTNAVAYTAMGRAAHEAVAIDPSNSDAYITEDAGGGLLYKFVPTDTSQQFGSLGNGGVLYAMKVPGYSDFGALSVDLPIGGSIGGITWTQAANPDVAALNASFDSATVTRGNKLEGCWWIDGKLWFVQSYSGSSNSGAVFAYDPTTSTLTLITKVAAGGQNVDLTDGVTTQSHLIRDPDNIAATPYGGAVWSQDGGSNQYLVALAPDGSFFPVARNPGGGEWAGAHFSIDGKWLIANQQGRSLTVAITGPWSPEPAAVIPEVPVGALLPLTGVAATAAFVAFRQRRMAALGRVENAG